VLLSLLTVLGLACADHELVVQFRTPATCPTDPGPCPMDGVASILVSVERPTGEIVASECLERPPHVCDYEDLEDLPLLSGVPPLSAVEIHIEGFGSDDCTTMGTYFCCDPVGSAIPADLENDAFPISLWCGCIPRIAPCPH
jgi:hypothetical protein